jgi:DNA-binding transcriptional LysR family regulator
MEMHQIRYFLAVCSERNFTRAAKHCHVSQPSLTRAIKLLEEEFGGLLFRRERANSHLTELGEIVRPHLQQVWDQSDAAIANAHQFAAEKRASLSIGIQCTIAPSLLVDLLARMRNRYRAIEFGIIDGSARDLEEQLVAGHITAAIYARQKQETDARLCETQLFRERMMIAMPRSHHLTSRTVVRVADLAGEPVVLRPRCEHHDLFARLLRQYRDGRAMNVDCVRDDWTLALIARGLGLALFPQHSIDHPEIVARPLAEPELWREISLFTSKERRHSEGLRAFVQEAELTSKATQAAG